MVQVVEVEWVCKELSKILDIEDRNLNVEHTKVKEALENLLDSKELGGDKQ